MDDTTIIDLYFARDEAAIRHTAEKYGGRLDDLALSEAINGFLGALDEEKRNLFLRRYWYLDSISDLARRFAMSESKVKTTLFRCRAQLRAHLEKEGYTL